MRILLAVISCNKPEYRAKVQAQRDTWFPLVKGMDLRVFIGEGEAQHPDEVILGCGDGYEHLPLKLKAVFKWALDNGYDGIWRVDDDVYVRPERLMLGIASGTKYQGRVRGATDPFHPWVYCSGFCYYLNSEAMRLVVSTKNIDTVEDRLTGLCMAEAGIEPVHDTRLVITKAARSHPCSDIGPRKDNDIAASCEWSAQSMLLAHEDFQKSSPPKPKPPVDADFSKVDILIKTILRDGYLRRTITSIQKNLPGARMVIVDDGVQSGFKPMLYSGLRQDGHSVHLMNYDSGFGAKSNAAIPLYRREYVLIGSDDFDFTPQAAAGIRKLVRVLDADPSIGIASGRFNERPYEFDLRETAPGCVMEVPADLSRPKKVAGEKAHQCDLTVNFSLIRRELLGMSEDKLHWWSDVKIGGGEHGAFFIRSRRLGIKTVYVEGANINEQRYFEGAHDPRYLSLRARARGTSRMALVHEGIREYLCHGSQVPERHQ